MREKYIISIVSKFGMAILFILANYFLFLNLKPNILGEWVFLNSIINIGFIFVNIGFDTIHLQYCGEDNASKYFGTFFIIKSVLIIANTTFAIILSFFLVILDENFFLILLLIISNSIFLFSEVFIINLKSRLKIFKSEIPYLLKNSGEILSILVLALNVELIYNPLLFLCLSRLIFNLVYLLITLFLSRGEFIISPPKRTFFLKYIKDTKPFIYYSIIYIISMNIGNIIIRYSIGYESLAYYGFVQNYIIGTLGIISSSLIQISISSYSKYYQNKNKEVIKELTFKIEKYNSVIFLFIIIFTFVNGETLFLIFLPKYTISLPILYILIFYPYFLAITRPYGSLLKALRKQKALARINSSIHIFEIILMIFLIPSNIYFFQSFGLGIIGCAVAQTLPWVLWVFLIRYKVLKSYSLRPNYNIIKHFIIAFLSIISLSILNKIFSHLLSINLIGLLLINTVLIIIIFFVPLILIKEFKRNDLKFLFELLNLKKYISSLKEEFD